MALKLVAVDGCTLAHKLGSTITGGSFTITAIPSLTSKGEGNGVFTGTLTFTFTGGSAPGFVAGTVQTTAPQSISATAVFSKVDGGLVLREGDFGTMTCIGTLPPPPPGTTGPILGPVEISVAGQTTSKAD